MLGTSPVITKQDETRLPVEFEEFKHNPGIYYEKIGYLYQTEQTWKLVIKFDITELNDRTWQINQYIKQTNEMCKEIKPENSIKKTCDNLKTIINTDSNNLDKIITLINTLYKAKSDKRRGLIDGIGSITKTLFGIMDENDRKLINEQIGLLENKQQTLKHVAKNQIKILNSTIIHLNKLENILNYNGKLINHYIRDYTTREEIDEHFTIIIAMINNLIRDAKDILEYLTSIRQGIMHPLLTPITDIINQLKEAVLQLPRGSYFPFEINQNEWITIESFMKISVYCEKSRIYTILKFPIITQPMYEIFNVIPLPTTDYNNKFAYTEIENKLMIVNKEMRTYLSLTEQELTNCINKNKQYICESNHPIYHLSINTPCEIKIYVYETNYREYCNVRHVIINHTIWIDLRQPHSWLYSTTSEQQVTIKCDKHSDYKKIIRNTGRITLRDNCKITSTDITLQTKTITYTSEIEEFQPEYNITISKNNNYTNDGEKLKNIINNPTELKELSNKLEKINKDLNNNENNFFKQKTFIYPMASSGITTIIIIILIIWIIVHYKKKPKQSAVITLVDEIDKQYGRPKSILKRTKSTRF